VRRLEIGAILKTAREDHELVTEHIRLLERLERMLATGGSRPPAVAAQLARDGCGFLDAKLLPHCAEEEHTLFPFCQQYLPKGSTLIYELESEHTQIRDLAQRLRAELTTQAQAGGAAAAADLARLRPIIAQLIALLSHHAGRESELLEHYVACGATASQLAASGKA
jgi:hemerythrin-like domain-containing protein